jgi:DNA polymerase-3 subunit alpha
MTGLPDIDLDFEAGRRSEVVSYLKERYGTCQVRTYGAWSKRTAWLAVSKVMGLPKGTVKRIFEAMSDTLSLRMDIEFSSIIHHEFSSGSARTREALRNVIRLSDKHSGCNGIHACAVMLSRNPLASFIPVEESRGQIVSQYEAKQVEKAGAVKLDILGLGMLDVIHAACNQVSEESGTPLDIQSIPLDDPEALKVFSRGDTLGVIPFESGGMRDYLRAFRALTFDDLVAMNVLYRPGPIDRIPEFIDAANGNGRRESWFPYVDGYIRNTHGEIVFQEQVMLLASSIGGFSAEEANRFRKDVGRQNVGFANYHSDFISGGLAKGISEDILESVFHLLLERGKYAFLHTHAYCYTLLGWRLAWLKAHHPKAFFSSLLNTALRMGWDTDAYVKDCRAHGFEVVTPERSENGLFDVMIPG